MLTTELLSDGFSISSCMSSALSEPDGMGLGTVGFNPAVCERMCRGAGFDHWRQLDYKKDAANLYYEVAISPPPAL